MRIEGDCQRALNEFLSAMGAPTLTTGHEIMYFTRVHLHGVMYYSSRYYN